MANPLPRVVHVLGKATWDAKALCTLIQASKSTGQLVLRMGTFSPALLDVKFSYRSAQPPSRFIAWVAQYGVLVRSLSLKQGYSRKRFDFLAVAWLIAEAVAVASTATGHEAAVQLSLEAVQNIRIAIKEQERNNKDKATESLNKAWQCALQSLEQVFAAAEDQASSKQYVMLRSLKAHHMPGKYFNAHSPLTRLTRLSVQLDDTDAPLFASQIMPLLSNLTYLDIASSDGGLYHETDLWAPVWQQITNVSSLELTGLVHASVLRQLPAAALERLRVDKYHPDVQEFAALSMVHLTELTWLDLNVWGAIRASQAVLPSSLQQLEYDSRDCNVASLVRGLTNLQSLKLWAESADGRPLADLVLSQTALPALTAVTLIYRGDASFTSSNSDRLVGALGPRLRTLCSYDKWSLSLCQAVSTATCLTQLCMCVQGVAHNISVFEAFKAALPSLVGLKGFFLGSTENLKSHSRLWTLGNEILEIAKGLVAKEGVAPLSIWGYVYDRSFSGVRFSEEFLVHDDVEPITGGCVAACDIPEPWQD